MLFRSMRTPSGDVFSTSFPEYHKECEQLTRAEGEKIYRAQVLADTKKKIKPGQTIYCTFRSVSASGMQRRISLHTIHKGKLIPLDHAASVLTGRTLSDKGGIVCHGCGMDMGFEIVYNLSMALFCPDEYDHDAAYSLKHEWI